LWGLVPGNRDIHEIGKTPIGEVYPSKEWDWEYLARKAEREERVKVYKNKDWREYGYNYNWKESE
jgi:hypothetical protein